jgi:hypothetical protein
MTAQLALIDVAAQPRLTDRQQHALQTIQQAGWAGLHTDELGAHIHDWQRKHSSDETCEWCATSGLEVGRALRAKGLVQQRRRKAPGGDTVMVWTVSGRLPRASSDSNEIPY